MYVEVRPTATSVALRPDPKSPPVFDIRTEEEAVVILELASDPKLFEPRAPARTDSTYARIESDTTTPGAARGSLQTRRPKGLSQDSSGAYIDKKGAVVLASCRYRLSEAEWKRLMGNRRLYYRALALPTPKRLASPDSSYLRPNVFDAKMEDGCNPRLPGSSYVKPNLFDVSMTTWAPFVEILRDDVAKCYRRDGKDPSTRPWLMRSGNAVVRGKNGTSQSSDPVRLCGINMSGLQHRLVQYARPVQDQSGHHCPATTWREAAEISRPRLELVRSWGATIVRLPINQQWAVNGRAQNNQSAEAMRLRYLADIDAIVDICASLEMYVLLEMQLIDYVNELKLPHKPSNPAYMAAMPDNLSLVLWAMLASRYRDEPNVLFDLCNEPHIPDPDQDPCYYTGYIVANKSDVNALTKWTNLWKEWAVTLEEMIHSIHRDALIFVSGFGGPAYSSDLRMMPIMVTRSGKEVPLPNVVYSAHFYPETGDGGLGTDPKSPPSASPTSQGTEANGSGKSKKPLSITQRAAVWDKYLGPVRDEHPIFLAEWGPKENSDVSKPEEWVRDLAAYLISALTGGKEQRRGLVGWTAWSWGDNPKLIEDETRVASCSSFDGRTPIGKLTAWGTIMQTALKTTLAVTSATPGKSP